MKMASFEKLKSDLNQNWFIDIIYEPSQVHAVKGHVPRSGHLRSSCKAGRKCENGLI